MKGQFRLSLLLLTFALGCQKSPNLTSAAGVESSVGVMSNCQSGPTTDASILGLSNMKSGQMVQLALSPGVNCDQAQTAQWKIGDVVVGSGPQISTRINGTGVYSVSVQLGESSATKANNKLQAALSTTSLSSLTAVTDSQVLLVGPGLTYQDQEVSYSLAVPTSVQLVRADWDFGDGSSIVSSLAAVKHIFPRGTYTITVTTVDANNQTQVLHQTVTVLVLPDGGLCPLDQLAISGPVDVPVARRVTYSLNLSTCLRSHVTQAIWNFGDASASVNSLTALHAFAGAGTYTLSVQITLYGQPVTLSEQIVVSDNMETMPGPVPTPTPDLNKCPTEGETRVSSGAITTESQSCGLQGNRSNSYQEQITETCKTVNGIRDWVQTSSTRVLVSEGSCQAQSCQLVTAAGTEVLKDGQSRILYTSSIPTAACSSVQETRVCNNGVLSGSTAAQFSTCHSGCGDFGVHGTVKSAVVTGEVQQAVACQFGESGVTSTYNQLSDLTCQDGQVVTSNTRQGDIKTAGQCPTYSFVASDSWSQCSADCGGSQNRIYECRNNAGVLSAAERCQGSAPVESRVCDGNPEAVKRSEVSISEEEAPSCGRCPANQIGVTVQKREIHTTKTFACLNHQVQLADTQTQMGAWVKESYCRDLVPMRCSHDSLSNTQAKGRYDWMVKCQESVPAIKEFLANLENTKYEGYGIKNTSRLLYPTFLNTTTQKPWIAPTTQRAGCEAPESIYVAAVCVSSCSTPEQQILVEAEKEKKLKYVPFVQALTQNLSMVATLQNASSMSSQTLASTQVDSWVTELLDEDHPMLIFKMRSGGRLQLTLNHPLLSEEGVMKLASDFQVGESLVQVGGQLDPIVSIEATVYHGKVYNLFVKSSDLKKNVVVTNGYLNGTAMYQNEGAKFMNRALFRENLFRGAFPSKGQSK